MAQKSFVPNETSPAVVSTTARKIRVSVYPTTGGRLDLNIAHTETVNCLKWIVSRNLRIPPEKITLLYKNRPLDCGNLQSNQVLDGSHITLLPNMESGLSVQKTEVGVIQALENLSDSQVNDFLSGKAPLLLAMRLGEHMMFVQLQLSTTACVNRRSRPPADTASPTVSPPSNPSPEPATLPSTTVVNSTVTGRTAQGPPLSPTSLNRASRNLSQKLKELSRITALNPTLSPEPSPPKPVSKDSGAVIESMQHHGKGVYSGTFSGTLDPTLQDSDGKPKRDISTIIHILNDLLGANPPLQPQNPCAMGRIHQRRVASATYNQYQQQLARTHSEAYGSKANDEESALRGKLQHLQQMMEDRRVRRRARRGLKSPYQWHGLKLENKEEQSCQMTAGSSEVECVKPEAVNTMPESVAVNDTSYSSTTPMEHETVAV